MIDLDLIGLIGLGGITIFLFWLKPYDRDESFGKTILKGLLK